MTHRSCHSQAILILIRSFGKAPKTQGVGPCLLSYSEMRYESKCVVFCGTLEPEIRCGLKRKWEVKKLAYQNCKQCFEKFYVERPEKWGSSSRMGPRIRCPWPPRFFSLCLHFLSSVSHQPPSLPIVIWLLSLPCVHLPLLLAAFLLHLWLHFASLLVCVYAYPHSHF